MLLSALALMGFYIFWIRVPKTSLNKKVFSSPMSGLNIAESSDELVGRWRVGDAIRTASAVIRVRNIDDLEKIYKLLVSTHKL